MSSVEGTMLIEKRLSHSDLSGEVLKTGRVVLPRQQVWCHVGNAWYIYIHGVLLCKHLLREA